MKIGGGYCHVVETTISLVNRRKLGSKAPWGNNSTTKEKQQEPIQRSGHLFYFWNSLFCSSLKLFSMNTGGFVACVCTHVKKHLCFSLVILPLTHGLQLQRLMLWADFRDFALWREKQLWENVSKCCGYLLFCLFNIRGCFPIAPKFPFVEYTLFHWLYSWCDDKPFSQLWEPNEFLEPLPFFWLDPFSATDYS